MPDALRGGRYVITRLLGEGGQACTYEAVDKRVGRLVAIKAFSVRGATSWKDVELAEREARVLAQLKHTAVPEHVEHFEEDGTLYLVMEKIEGESLAIRKAQGERWREEDAWRFLGEMRALLAFLHGRDKPIVHRDLKPANIVRRPDGSIAVVDFGAVRDQLRTSGGSTVVGTFGYMAPEQFQGRAAPASDVYAVAATTLTMMTGQEPEALPHRGLGIDVDAALGDRASPELRAALRSMLEPDPDRRADTVVVDGEASPPHAPPRATIRPTASLEHVRREWPRLLKLFWVLAGLSWWLWPSSALQITLGMVVISILASGLRPRRRRREMRRLRVSERVRIEDEAPEESEGAPVSTRATRAR